MATIDDKLRDKTKSGQRKSHKKDTTRYKWTSVPHRKGSICFDATSKTMDVHDIKQAVIKSSGLISSISTAQNFAKRLEKSKNIQKSSFAFPYCQNSNSRFKIIKEIASNFKSHIALEKLIKNSGIPLTILAVDVLEINPKTLTAYRKSKKPLPTRLNEHVIKLNELYVKGIELFGESKQFNLWMKTKSFGLGNHVPLKLINSITGINLVYEELIRIEFGATA